MDCNQGGGHTFVQNAFVVVAPSARFKLKQTRGTRLCRAAAATGKAWCWLLLAFIMVSGSPPLCTCAAAAASKTYYSGKEQQWLEYVQISACVAYSVPTAVGSIE